MKIEIVTKFNIGDEVIGYVSKRGFRKYRVDDIRVQMHSIEYMRENIEYRCTLITNGDLTCQETFTQAELFTADDIYERLNKVVTYPTTTEQAKRDIEMYSEIKDLIQHSTPVFMSDNVRWIDCVKWLESKFPEIELCVKINNMK